MSAHKQDQPLPPSSESAFSDQPWLAAYRAAESKKAVGLRVLDLREVTTFTDFFIVCGGANSRQIQAISDEVTLRLKKLGQLPISVEGYENAEWVLIDYGDFIVHVFAEKARGYYDIERLWRGSHDITPAAGA